MSSLNENEPSGWKSSASLSASFLGMLNIGYRPTLNNGKERSIEVHILDFEGDLYGRQIRLEFYYFIRPEMKFPDLTALQQEILRNAAETRAYLKSREENPL